MQLILNGNKIVSKKIWQNNKGFSLVEILIVVGIVTIILASLLSLTVFSLKNAVLIKELNQANFLAQEASEIVRNFRDGRDWQDNGLASLDNDIAYYPEKDDSVSPAQWLLVQGEELIDQFTRKIVFSNVERDNNNNIVETGGTNDSETKKVTIIVSWKNKEIKIEKYLTNWQEE